MTTLPKTRRAAALGIATLLVTALAACSPNEASNDASPSSPDETAQTLTIEDNHGTHELTLPAKRVVSTDNRSFRTLDEWGVELVAVPLPLMPEARSYATVEGMIDLGSHNEPNLEAIVEADPDLIINGQRFAQHYADLAALAPDAVVLEFDPREGEPFDEELRRQTTALGQIFGHEDDAAKLIKDFDASIEAVKEKYDAGDTVMAVITSGGSINYSAPTTGRTLGPVYDILGLTPAITVEGSTDHMGDDISVEAIAEANPDWIMVLDRDAATAKEGGADYTPANEIIASSEALKNVTAVKEGRIVYMPAYTYTDESIQTYTEFFTSFAQALGN